MAHHIFSPIFPANICTLFYRFSKLPPKKTPSFLWIKDFFQNPQHTMYAARATKPKLSLSISTTQNVSHPSQSLKSPSVIPPTPISPASSTARNTWANQHDCATRQTPTRTYANSSSSKSILKKHQTSQSGVSKRIQFDSAPTIYYVTPIDSEDYYGSFAKMSRDERRWGLRT
jgi:hypothetical protein